MKAYPHQEQKADECCKILKEKGYVYLAGKPRSGKTLTAILIAEKSNKINSVIILTKKSAISGWEKFINCKELKLKHKYFVTNYEQVSKLNPKDYQLAIIDESHNIGTVGKPTQRFKLIKKLCWDLPHIHLSGTAIVETPNSIYYQMAISKYTPFRHKHFYDFFSEYGIPHTVNYYGRTIMQYKRAKDTLLRVINSFTVYMSQYDAGLNYSATDLLHYVELDAKTKTLYNTLQKDKMIKFDNIADELICDNVMKLRLSLHMLESGVAKINQNNYDLNNNEKIDYIKKTFGDDDSIGIMCHFIAEKIKLQKHFKKAKIYSSNADAEGTDLSHLKQFIILSNDYSGAKFIQRRERIINLKGSNTQIVNHILVKNAISEQVYRQVSKKKDFNNSTYESKEI